MLWINSLVNLMSFVTYSRIPIRICVSIPPRSHDSWTTRSIPSPRYQWTAVLSIYITATQSWPSIINRMYKRKHATRAHTSQDPQSLVTRCDFGWGRGRGLYSRQQQTLSQCQRQSSLTMQNCSKNWHSISKGVDVPDLLSSWTIISRIIAMSLDVNLTDVVPVWTASSTTKSSSLDIQCPGEVVWGL
jgi:hypothetical protein